MNEPYPKPGVVQDVTLSMVFGALKFSGDAEALVEGQVHYNTNMRQPSIEKDDNKLRGLPIHSLAIQDGTSTSTRD